MSKTHFSKLVRPSPKGFFRAATVVLATALSANAAQAAGIAWQSNVREARRLAASLNKPMLVMVKARWCGPCHQMLSQTFPNSAVAARINTQFVPLLIDADEQAAFVQSLGVEAMPTVLVISPQQRITGRFVGFQSAAQLDARLAAFVPSPIRQSAAPQIGRSAPLVVGQPMAPRPEAAPPMGVSFLRRHAIARLPARPKAIIPAPPRPDPPTDTAPIRAVDTLTAAKAFGAGSSTAQTTVSVGPVPNPPD